MKNIVTLTKKELKDYFTSTIAYVVIAVFLIVTSILFIKDVFIDDQATMRKTFEFIPLILAIIIPALTMRSWAEEKKEGTIEIIRTLPIKKAELILGKFLATLLLVIFMLILLLPIPVMLNILGNPDNGVIAAGFLGLILLSATYILIGQFVSINSQNQIVSFIISTAIIAVLFIIGESRFLELVPVTLRTYFGAIGIGTHFESIAKGVIDTRDILYYFSTITIVFAFIYKSLNRIGKLGK